MELVNDFTVNVPVDEAWVTLTDVERIAPCLPGAQLQEVEGDVYRGVVKVKVGPILAQFKGQATFIEKDDVNHKAVLKAEGRDTGGKGNASALITAQLEPLGDAATKVTVYDRPDDHRQGRPVRSRRPGRRQHEAARPVRRRPREDRAHPGQGRRRCPGDDRPPPATPRRNGAPAVTAGAEPAAASTAAAPGVRRIEQRSHEPVDLLDVAGGALAKRLAPIGIVALLVLLIVVLRKRRAD